MRGNRVMGNTVLWDRQILRIDYNSNFELTEFFGVTTDFEYFNMTVNEVKELARQSINGTLRYQNLEIEAIKQEDNTYKYILRLPKTTKFNRRFNFYIDKNDKAPLEKKYENTDFKLKKVYYIWREKRSNAIISRAICTVTNEQGNTEEIELSSRELALNIPLKKENDFWKSSYLSCFESNKLYGVVFETSSVYAHSKEIELIEDPKLINWKNKISVIGKYSDYNIRFGSLAEYTGQDKVITLPPVQSISQRAFEDSQVGKVILHPDFLYMQYMKEYRKIYDKYFYCVNSHRSRIKIDASKIKPLDFIKNTTELQKFLITHYIYDEETYIDEADKHIYEF
jgi:hypothetical protein